MRDTRYLFAGILDILVFARCFVDIWSIFTGIGESGNVKRVCLDIVTGTYGNYRFVGAALLFGAEEIVYCRNCLDYFVGGYYNSGAKYALDIPCT